ncbi:hypothetical protein GHT09_015527 [Marmota monax]|uniref:Uncharacterized protein n=1 Tax=Marmota monax TaxID=9995 RepID=A0A834PWX3_MARMO|nr:hypothetical protein GHT09_015527 [Marmota monax]
MSPGVTQLLIAVTKKVSSRLTVSEVRSTAGQLPCSGSCGGSEGSAPDQRTAAQLVAARKQRESERSARDQTRSPRAHRCPQGHTAFASQTPGLSHRPGQESIRRIGLQVRPQPPPSHRCPWDAPALSPMSWGDLPVTTAAPREARCLPV